MSIVDYYAPALERAGYGIDPRVWVDFHRSAGLETPHADRAAHMAWQRRELARLTVEAAVLEAEGGPRHSRHRRFLATTRTAAPVRTRATPQAEPTGIVGYAAVYNSRTTIGGTFEEEIREGAFDHVLGADVVALLNHDTNYVLGRTPSTLKLSSDTHGLRYEIPELPKARADVLEAVRRGDIRGNSFSFDMDPAAGAEAEYVTTGALPLRIIHRVGRLFDVGPVTLPAYEATSVGARKELGP